MGENQKQPQPTYDVGSWNRTPDTLVGGECSHLCAIPAPLNDDDDDDDDEDEDDVFFV